MMSDEALRQAFDTMLNATPEEIHAYEARLKHVFDEEAAIREAELREINALEKGIKQGLEQGQQNEKLEMAKKMLLAGFEVVQVVHLTELTKAEVVKIQEEM